MPTLAKASRTRPSSKAEGRPVSASEGLPAIDVPGTPDKGGVQSIERAFAILTEIAEQDGINLTDLAKRVGLHNSTAFHIVRTMLELGMVRQDRDTKKYYLGRAIFFLAAGASTEVQLSMAAMPHLEALAAATGESSHLAIRSGQEAKLTTKVAGSGAFQMVERAGGIRPLHCTAIGKVLLAFAPDDLFEALAKAAPFESFTSKTISEAEQLREEIRRVRETGIGYDDGEFDLEVRCVAAAVRDFRGEVVAAIGISGPIWRINLQRLTELSQQVRETAALVSAELGYRAGA